MIYVTLTLLLQDGKNYWSFDQAQVTEKQIYYVADYGKFQYNK